MRCKQKQNPTVIAEKAFDFLIEEDRQDQNLPSPSLLVPGEGGFWSILEKGEVFLWVVCHLYIGDRLGG